MSDFFNVPKIATEEHCKARWSLGKPGEFFRCALCGHKFVPGDEFTICYTNDMLGSGGNPICCSAHGSVPQLRAQWKDRCEEYSHFKDDRFWFFTKHAP